MLDNFPLGHISLPTTKEDFYELKDILIKEYKIEDSPEVWYTICSHIQSSKAWETHKPLKELADVARKVIINRIAQDQKVIEGEKIQDKLKKAMEKAANEFKEQEQSIPASSLPEADGSDVSDRTHRV